MMVVVLPSIMFFSFLVLGTKGEPPKSLQYDIHDRRVDISAHILGVRQEASNISLNVSVSIMADTTVTLHAIMCDPMMLGMTTYYAQAINRTNAKLSLVGGHMLSMYFLHRHNVKCNAVLLFSGNKLAVGREFFVYSTGLALGSEALDEFQFHLSDQLISKWFFGGVSIPLILVLLTTIFCLLSPRKNKHQYAPLETDEEDDDEEDSMENNF